MYLTGGQYKGRKIEVPKGVKPTLSKVRESIFNMLQGYDFNDYSFLDMCAGSGIMGLEAISRGYKVTGLEINPKTAEIIRNTYKNIGLKANIIVCDSLKYKINEKYEIIYIDPPWAEEYSKFILKANDLIADRGIIVLEYDEKNPIKINEIINTNEVNLEIIKSKKYGRCLISFLRKN